MFMDSSQSIQIKLLFYNKPDIVPQLSRVSQQYNHYYFKVIKLYLIDTSDTIWLKI